MIETQATVVKVEGSIAYVKVYKESACGACSVAGGEESCGTSTLARFFTRRAPLYQVRNSVEARVGDSVVIGVEESALLKGSLAVYISPLVFVVLGAVAAGFLAPTVAANELYSILGAAAGLAAGFVWLRVYSRMIAGNPRLQPVILRKYSTMNRVINIAEVQQE